MPFNTNFVKLLGSDGDLMYLNVDRIDGIVIPSDNNEDAADVYVGGDGNCYYLDEQQLKQLKQRLNLLE